MSAGVAAFFLLACGITWALDVPWVIATIAQREPSPGAMAMGGFGALGPTLAAFIVAAKRRQLPSVFGRWRTSPMWIVAAILTTPALHAIATSIEVALGGRPAAWFYPPTRPEHIAALVMFSVGEEFGWRGYAYPRLAEKLDPIRSALAVGAVWSVWHLGMWFTTGTLTVVSFAVGFAELTAASVVLAWMFERSNRSMAVAIAFHAGGHVDNVFRAPEHEIRLRALRLGVLAIAAVVAAGALHRSRARSIRQVPEPADPSS